MLFMFCYYKILSLVYVVIDHHIINKVSKSISIIYRASQKLNETALLMLYNTLILPYLSYCSEVWG